MPKFDGKTLRSIALGCMFCAVAGSVALPNTASAQTVAAVRGLPDFTDLVDQVGPSVVNIRTVEKASSRANANGMDEEMLEFFRRFDQSVLRPFATPIKHVNGFALVSLVQHCFKLLDARNLGVGDRHNDITFTQTGT